MYVLTYLVLILIPSSPPISWTDDYILFPRYHDLDELESGCESGRRGDVERAEREEKRDRKLTGRGSWGSAVAPVKKSGPEKVLDR